MAKAKRKDGFAVGFCSVCENPAVTLGQQHLGGVRYCAECIRHTLAWVQWSEEERTHLTAAFATIGDLPKVKKQLEEANKTTPEQRKANAVGESRRRLIEANAAENRD